jgi:hypothetical protein
LTRMASILPMMLPIECSRRATRRLSVRMEHTERGKMENARWRVRRAGRGQEGPAYLSMSSSDALSSWGTATPTERYKLRSSWSSESLSF